MIRREPINMFLADSLWCQFHPQFSAREGAYEHYLVSEWQIIQDIVWQGLSNKIYLRLDLKLMFAIHRYFNNET